MDSKTHLRVISGCESIPEVAIRMASVSVYAKVGKQGTSYRDAQETSTVERFLDALRGFYVSEGGFPMDGLLKRARLGPTLSGQCNGTCFYCGKLGLRKADCWQLKNQQQTKSDTQPSQPSLKNDKVPT